MRIGLPKGLMPKPGKLSAQDVIQSELKKAYDLHPGHLFPASIVVALEDAGFMIMSADELDTEIALAFQAGVDSVLDA